MSLGKAAKRIALTTDSRVFKPEINKIVKIGTTRPKKMWIVCDGSGGMHLRTLDSPTKQIEDWAKLRDKGLITDEEFKRAKTRLPNQLDPQHGGVL